MTLLWLPPRSRDITGGCGGWYLEETSSEYPCECVCVCVCVLVRKVSQVQFACTHLLCFEVTPRCVTSVCACVCVCVCVCVCACVCVCEAHQCSCSSGGDALNVDAHVSHSLL